MSGLVEVLQGIESALTWVGWGMVALALSQWVRVVQEMARG